MGNIEFIEKDEKFAILAASVAVDGLNAAPLKIADDLWLSAAPPVSFDALWREWLGSIRCDHLSSSRLFIIAKKRSNSPTILDDENLSLTNKVGRYWTALLLTGQFYCDEAPLLLTGTNTGSGIEIQKASDLSRIIVLPGHSPPNISRQQLSAAAAIMLAIEQMVASGPFQRFSQIMHIYGETRSNSEPLDQVHQYARCLEGFIIPKPGDLTKKFKSRTELFIGSAFHDLMGKIYEIRSAVEHLNDYLIVQPPDRAIRIDVIRKALIVEFIARHCIVCVLRNSRLWAHFESDAAFERFWALPDAERRNLWGQIIDPKTSLDNFEPDHIRNHQIGMT